MNANMTLGTPKAAGSLTVAYTGTAGTTSAIPADCTCVRVISTTDCFIEITVAGTAAVANTGLYLAGGLPEYFACLGGSKVSAIQVSSGGTIYCKPINKQ